MEELVELETAPEAGVRGIRVGRDSSGLYVTKAPKSLRVHQGDQLLSARLFFEGVPPEDVEQVLEGVGSCKVSFCVRRSATGVRGPPSGTGEGHLGKVARLSIPILTPSKKAPAAPSPASAAPTGGVAAVEFALPKIPKLVKSRSVAERAPTTAPTPVPLPAEPKRLRATPSRLTVKEAAAGKTARMEQPRVKPETPGVAAEVPAGASTRFPAVEVVVPKVSVGLSLTGAAPPATPQAKELALRLPQLEVAVPALPLPAAAPEPGTTTSQPQIKAGEGDARGSSRKDGGSPVPKTRLPDVGKALAEGEDGDAGTRRGFVGIRVPSIDITVPSAAVELVPELGVPKPELAITGGQPWLEAKLPARRLEPPPAAPTPSTLPVPAVPSIDIAVPRVSVGLALPAGAGATVAPGEGSPVAMPDLAARFAKGLRKLSLELEPAAPLPAVEIAPPARLAEGMPATRPKPSKFTLPRFGLSLAKLKTGSDGDGHPPVPHGTAVPTPPSAAIASPTTAVELDLGTVGVGGAGVKLKVPKLSLAPFGAKDGDEDTGGEKGPQGTSAGLKLPRLGIGEPAEEDGGRLAEPGSPGTPRLRVPRVGIALPAAGGRRVPSLPKLPTGPELGGGVKLTKFGGSSPDIRIGGCPKVLRRGGSAESLSLSPAGKKTPESPGLIWLKLKSRGAMGDGGAPPSTPPFTVPAVGFTTLVKQPEDAVSRKTPKPTGVVALKVPALELVPPGMDGMEETKKDPSLGRWPRVKLPKFGAGSGLEGEGRTRPSGVKAAVAGLVKPKEKGEAKRVVGPHPHVNGDTEGKARRRCWVPRVGFSPPPEPPVAQPKMWFPTVELSPREPDVNQQPGLTEVTPRFHLGGVGAEGTRRFQLPKLALSPQPCGEW